VILNKEADKTLLYSPPSIEITVKS